MKKVIIYFSVMAASCMLGSCSDLAFGDAFLEKAPGVDVTIDTIFSSKLYADRALNSAYATLRTGLTVHANDGNFEHQQAGNKLGWDRNPFSYLRPYSLSPNYTTRYNKSDKHLPNYNVNS